MNIIRRIHIFYVLILFLSIIILPVNKDVYAFPLSTDSEVIKQALNFFKANQKDDGGFGAGGITEWVMIAIAATGQDPRGWYRNGKTPLDCLKTQKLTKNPYDWIRMTLVLVAIGENPRSFNGINYVEKIKKFYQNGQFGDPFSLRDDCWAALALIAASENKSEEVKNSVKFILKHQNPDGSWGASTTGIEICADNTAAAINLLIASGVKPDSEAIKLGLNYLRKVQAPDGGFTYLFIPSNTATDSSVIQALCAAGQDPAKWIKQGNNPITHLLSLQEPEGYFKWTTKTSSNPLMMTSMAIPALLGKSFPIKPFRSDFVTVDLRIEGIKKNIIHTRVTYRTGVHNDTGGQQYTSSFPSPLSALSEVAIKTGLVYTIEKHALGLFLKNLNNETGAWQYRVNDRLPWISANEYELKSGDEVVWFYDQAECKSPLRIHKEIDEIYEGDEIKFSVKQYDDNKNVWYPVSEALMVMHTPDSSLHKGESFFIPVQGGKVIIPFKKKGVYSVYAEKEHAIRSIKHSITVEERRAITVSLRIEDNGKSLWQGIVTFSGLETRDFKENLVLIRRPVILGALEAARKTGIINYKVINTSQGLILFSINGLEENNIYGSWWYEVNGKKVLNNIDEYVLQNGDDVLLYRGRHFKQ